MLKIFQDLVFGARLFIKKPGFTLIAVLTLALGIGANTAIFSIINTVLLSPLPYSEPERLMMVWEHNLPRSRTMNVVNPGNFMDWQKQSGSFEEMAGMYDSLINLTGNGDPEELPIQYVTPNMLSMLGVRPLYGRTFVPEDGKPDSDSVIVLGYGLWQRRFGGDSNIVNKTINLNGRQRTVVGIMPPNFKLFIKEMSLTGKSPELWTQFQITPEMQQRRGRFMRVIGRLKPGVTVEAAKQEMITIGRRLETEYPDFNTGWTVNTVPLGDQLTGEVKTSLWILMAAVGFVLLIASANVANLQLARAVTREKELAIRQAMGAGRWRIIRQLLTENLLLAALGGAVGIMLAIWAIELLPSIVPREMLQVESVTIDPRVLWFTAGISLMTGIIFGIYPAWASSRRDLNDLLKEGGKGAGQGGHRLSSTLVIAQVALALVLLVGAGLLIRSLIRLQSIDPGFRPDNLMTARISLPGSKYSENSQRTQFFKQIVERINRMPGVQSAGAISFLPFGSTGAATSFSIVGRPEPPAGQDPVTDVRVIDEHYIRTMKIPLIEGRLFNAREAEQDSDTIIINQTLARQYFPGESPIGRKIVVNMKDENLPSEIIGVVGDVRHTTLDDTVRAMVYWPHPQLAYPFMTLVVRTESDPESIVSGIRNQVRSLDPAQPLSNVTNMEALLTESVGKARFATFLLSLFALLALALATVGIYGIISYTVSRRTHEIGIRMALGASASDVLRMVIGQGMKLALAGAVIGVLASIGLMRFLSSQLYQISAFDNSTYLSGVILLSGVALLACWLPARRATRVDPMVALRYE
ncbi:MAG: ABC transporter permease [Acidobacteriota bacterium]|nr:MAG: ABC transporter permease [Acidobacteriota bacterium]